MTTTTNKGFEYGWNAGDSGWGAGMNENIQRADAFANDQWGNDIDTTTGLTYGYRGGLTVSATGVIATVGASTLTLTDDATNYVERTVAGVVSKNTTGFTTGALPMAVVVVAGGVMTSITDRRIPSTQVPTGLPPSGAAGGVLGGTYPNPSFAADMATQAELDAVAAAKADTAHTHAAADITSGTVATARLGSGTADATTFLRGDQSWATPSGSSGVTVRKNSTGSDFTRARLNLIEGANVTLTVSDDAGDDEVDVTIAATTSSGGGPFGTNSNSPDAITSNNNDTFPTGGLDTTGARFTGAEPWAWRNQGTSTAPQSKGAIRLAPQADTQWHIVEQDVPAGTWTIRAEVGIEGAETGDRVGGVVLVDPGSGKLIILWIGNSGTNGAVLTYWDSVSAFASNVATVATGVPDIPGVLEIEDDGTDYHFRYSYHGSAFHTLHSASRTAHLTTAATKVGLAALASGGTPVLVCREWYQVA